MVGHAYAINACTEIPEEKEGDEELTKLAYQKAAGKEWTVERLVDVAAKCESTLIPGIFLDYYMRHDGTFSGQYVYIYMRTIGGLC